MSASEIPKFNVLIVDDERANLHILFHKLKEEYNVSAANSGEKALEKAQAERPDLILLDIVMPDMDGYEVLTRLKGSKDTQDIPVIFITGLGSPEEETKGLFLGAVDYITKPLNMDVVCARIRTHLKIVWQMRLIEQLGLIDPLTSAANRRRFDRQIEIEWARAVREQTHISMLMLDIDNFKSYNDTYGHPAGDALLQTFVMTASGVLKRATDLFARVGGEEFAVLLSSTDMQGAVAVGEDIRASIENLSIPSGYDPKRPVTVSIGANSVIPGQQDVPADFITACDKNLYRAKETGKNRVVYSTP